MFLEKHFYPDKSFAGFSALTLEIISDMLFFWLHENWLFLTESLFLLLRLFSIFKLKISLAEVSGKKIISLMYLLRSKPGKQIYTQNQQCKH